MNPLSAFFGAGVAIRNALYDRGVFKARKLARPVVSVGNISVGGSGKTPFVIALGQLLKERGIAFDVLSRGYGRRSSEIAVVDPQGRPEQYGDEPLLIARKLQVPVIVGADRYRAGLLAEQKFSARLHLLDDGFQHRRLHRDFDIVMLPAADLTDTLLPAGRLREPLAGLRRADAVVIEIPETETDLQKQVQALEPVNDSPDAAEKVMAEQEMKDLAAQGLSAAIWRVHRDLEVDGVTGLAVAFCGIARARQFFFQLQEAKITVLGTLAFPDHHRYAPGDVERLLELKALKKANCFVTTEKDEINLGELAGRLQPLRIASLKITLEDPTTALNLLLRALEQRGSCRF
jgi:tetraacyldisaccharide 4'-kinase